MPTGKNPLLVICSDENENQSSLAAQLDNYRKTFPDVSDKLLAEMLQQKLCQKQHIRESKDLRYASSIDPQWLVLLKKSVFV